MLIALNWPPILLYN